MAKFRVELRKSAQKELHKIPKKELPRLISALKSLEENPRPNGYKKLKGAERINLWRVRVGNYRIIYQIEEEIHIVDVRRIGHRKEVYK